MKQLLTIFLLLVCLAVQAQAPADTLAPRPRPIDSAALARAQAAQRYRDSVRNAFVQDSLRTLQVRDSLRQVAIARYMRSVDSSRYNHNPYMRFSNPQRRIAELKKWEGKEGVFYGIVAVVLLFGLLRSAFSRYLADLFRTYFRTTIRQRIVKEQVANAPLPSLLFNLLYLLAAGLLAALLLQHFGLGTSFPIWQLYLYCLAALAAIYLTKFLVLKIFGWMLHASEAINTYIFIVFATNKVLGILILPVILGLAFTQGNLYEVFYTICLIVVVGLFVYRFYLSFLSVQKLMRITLFHFLVYLLAFEIAPLLLINKLLVQFFG